MNKFSTAQTYNSINIIKNNRLWNSYIIKNDRLQSIPIDKFYSSHLKGCTLYYFFYKYLSIKRLK